MFRVASVATFWAVRLVTEEVYTVIVVVVAAAAAAIILSITSAILSNVGLSL